MPHFIDINNHMQFKISPHDGAKLLHTSENCSGAVLKTLLPLTQVLLSSLQITKKRLNTKLRGGGGGMNWEIGIDIYTLICIK